MKDLISNAKPHEFSVEILNSTNDFALKESNLAKFSDVLDSKLKKIPLTTVGKRNAIEIAKAINRLSNLY